MAERDDPSVVSHILEHPILLLAPNSARTTLVPQEDALTVLRALGDTPLTCASIVGTTRGGKSSLMNLLFKRCTGGSGCFGLGHTHDPTTVGLWLWVRKHPSMPGKYCAFVDTEGLDAPHVSQFYNYTLSAITCLLSDVLLYQSTVSVYKREREKSEVGG
jgi:hypothetical protein